MSVISGSFYGLCMRKKLFHIIFFYSFLMLSPIVEVATYQLLPLILLERFQESLEFGFNLMENCRIATAIVEHKILQ